jgi:hypothetical protein
MTTNWHFDVWRIMKPTMRTALAALLRSLAAVCLLILFAQRTHAEIACPVIIFDGKADQEDLGLTLMNTAKVPIRQLEFYCTAVGGHSARRSVCHVETGIFYPGTPYPIRFSFASKGARTVLVSMRSVQLSESYLWTAIHDQACRSLRISAKTK